MSTKLSTLYLKYDVSEKNIFNVTTGIIIDSQLKQNSIYNYKSNKDIFITFSKTCFKCVMRYDFIADG